MSEDQIPYEIERKFLIAYPDLNWLSDHAERSRIVQTYLLASEGESARVRMRGLPGHYVYTHTVKQHISDLRRIEWEREIPEEEYRALLVKADPARRTIEKERYCLPFEGQLFEIDVFPFWQRQAVMEIELKDEAQPVSFPPEIRILREVSGDARYTNSAMALRIPEED